MGKNLNKSVNKNESITKTTANINTPTIVMSVETESTEKKGVQPNSNKDNSETIKINFDKCCMKLCNFFTMSTVLLFFSIGLGIAEIVLFIKSDGFAWGKVFIGIFLIISLILSVVVKLKTDEEKSLKLMLVRSFIANFNKEGIGMKEVEYLEKILNSIDL